MPELDIQPTPNPDSLKITASSGSFTELDMESYSSADHASESPLASSLFAVSGVINVFIMPSFLTITKDPVASWDAVLPPIKNILEAFLPD